MTQNFLDGKNFAYISAEYPRHRSRHRVTETVDQMREERIDRHIRPRSSSAFRIPEHRRYMDQFGSPFIESHRSPVPTGTDRYYFHEIYKTKTTTVYRPLNNRITPSFEREHFIRRPTVVRYEDDYAIPRSRFASKANNRQKFKNDYYSSHSNFYDFGVFVDDVYPTEKRSLNIDKENEDLYNLGTEKEISGLMKNRYSFPDNAVVHHYGNELSNDYQLKSVDVTTKNRDTGSVYERKSIYI
ncbi:hypothetical protein WR25_07169 [Diploscapter pachys]|uniref:Uncharacterized protein n=1 Tax=Diploscapter pachys TaxID=2018661 RepID=A0A2A2KUU6_9BILA|nr:hypothetical protein WR25_07169 [Diploscapter pachys]